ncbi:Arf GTPase activating protein [Parasponia andersonii]|uniref:Arf GTPase activating protein n=1 Tax=Parasponia andersonii TaxID=3476 RepID=A0A2P5B6Z6_PARAD|nr:Arf GTPase activating protein [Parasponia andersonii]
MNEKANVTKELNAKHRKVRSATLDTWLPDQVAFIQSMGNEKSNSYWEAELPPNYDRVGIENFIRAKYEEKRWVSREGKSKSPSRGQEEKAPMYWPRPVERVGHGYTGSSERLSEERKNIQQPTRKENVPATKVSIPVPPRGPEQVTPVPKAQDVQKVEPAVQQPEATKQAADSTPVAAPLPAATPPKVDYATDLFNMLSMDGPNENGSETASSDDNAWAGFQSAQETSTVEKTVPPKPVESSSKSNSGLEDLFKDSPVLTPSVSEKPQKDVKNDIMSLFEKSSIVSPFAMHQQQLAMLAQQQSLLMAAAVKSAGADPKFPASTQQPMPNGTNVPIQGWPNIGYPIPGMIMPMAGQGNQQNVTQAVNLGPSHLAGSSVPYGTSSFYGMGQVTPVNGVATGRASKTQSPSPISSASPTQTGKDYDFSSLTQGMFSKQ